jgi:hypothetical protein
MINPKAKTHPKPKIVVGPKKLIGDCFQPSIWQVLRILWMSVRAGEKGSQFGRLGSEPVIQ